MQITYIPNRGVLLRYPALQEVTRSRIGIPASASAKVAALMHADLVPEKMETAPVTDIQELKEAMRNNNLPYSGPL